MEYFVSHLPVIFGAAGIVAVAAILYWVSLERSAALKRRKAEARKAAAIKEKDANK